LNRQQHIANDIFRHTAASWLQSRDLASSNNVTNGQMTGSQLPCSTKDLSDHQAPTGQIHWSSTFERYNVVR